MKHDAPADLAMESRLLGAVVLDASILDRFSPVDLHSPANQAIAGAMHTLRGRGELVSTSGLIAELERTNRLRSAGGADRVLELTSRIETDPAACVRRLQELARLREMQRAALEVLQACADRDESAARAAARTLNGEAPLEDEIVPFAELIARGFSAVVRRDTGSDLRLGFPSIDADYRPGPGHLVVICARPNVGKTSLVTAAHHDCATRGIASGMISVDDDTEEVGVRELGAMSGVNPRRLWNERLTPGDIARVQDSIGRACDRGVQGLPFYFAHSRSKSIEAVEAIGRRMVRQHGVRWLSVDFLTKVRAPGRDPRERTDEALARLGVLASTLEIPIVVLAQLRRLGPGESEFREPSLSDLKESGRIEEDAQAVVMLWRDSDRPDAPTRGKLAKAKRAPAGRRFKLVRHPETGLLIESTEPDEPDEGSDAYSRARARGRR